MGHAAAFFDRDGVLNVDRGYVHRWSDWTWIPGAVESIRLANQAGRKVVVVTNQSGIARGYYAETDLVALNAEIQADLERNGARIDAFYHCPHGPDAGCPCRKPKPGMLEQAKRDLDLDPDRCFLVGDRETDMEAARSAGVRGYLYSGDDLTALVRRALAEVS